MLKNIKDLKDITDFADALFFQHYKQLLQKLSLQKLEKGQENFKDGEQKLGEEQENFKGFIVNKKDELYKPKTKFELIKNQISEYTSSQSLIAQQINKHLLLSEKIEDIAENPFTTDLTLNEMVDKYYKNGMTYCPNPDKSWLFLTLTAEQIKEKLDINSPSFDSYFALNTSVYKTHGITRKSILPVMTAQCDRAFEDFADYRLFDTYKWLDVQIKEAENVLSEIKDIKPITLPEKIVSFKDEVNDQLPAFSFTIIEQPEAGHEGTFVFFHGGPNGAYQLLNYARYYQDECGFDQIIISSGVNNTGSWSYQMVSQHYKSVKDLPDHSIFTSNSIERKTYHAPENMVKSRNPMNDFELNKALNPFFHHDSLPKIPYFIHVDASDHNVHGSQGIELWNKLKANGYDAKLVITEKGDHDLLTFDVRNFQCQVKAQNILFAQFADFIKDNRLQIDDTVTADTNKNVSEVLFFLPDYRQNKTVFKKYEAYQDWHELHKEWVSSLAGAIAPGIDSVDH